MRDERDGRLYGRTGEEGKKGEGRRKTEEERGREVNAETQRCRGAEKRGEVGNDERLMMRANGEEARSKKQEG